MNVLTKINGKAGVRNFSTVLLSYRQIIFRPNNTAHAIFILMYTTTFWERDVSFRLLFFHVGVNSEEAAAEQSTNVGFS